MTTNRFYVLRAVPMLAGAREEIYISTPSGTFVIRWYATDVGDRLSVRLEMFIDCWAAFHESADLFDMLADLERWVSPAVVACRLDDLGFRQRDSLMTAADLEYESWLAQLRA